MNTLRQHHDLKKQIGYATIASVLVLLGFISAIMIANFVDIKTQTKDARGAYYLAQAQEAAEAGIAYALAHVNANQGISSTPLSPPTGFPSATSFSVTLTVKDASNDVIQAISTGSLPAQANYTSTIQVDFAPTEQQASGSICTIGQQCRQNCRTQCYIDNNCANGRPGRACRQNCRALCQTCCSGGGGGGTGTKTYAIVPGSWADFVSN